MFEGLNIGLLDIIIIVVLVLAVLIGFISGFSKKRLGSFASQCAFIVTYFAGSPLAYALAQTDLSYYLQTAYEGALPTTEAFTTASVYSTNLSVGKTQISTALSEINIPSFLQGFFINHVQDASSTVGSAIASSFAYLTLIAATYVILFLVVFLLIRILLSPLWKEGSLFGEDGKSFFGRLCGVIRMVCKATLAILIAMVVLTLIAQFMSKAGNTSLQDWIDTDINTTEANGFSLARLFYNTASNLFQWISATASETTTSLLLQ